MGAPGDRARDRAGARGARWCCALVLAALLGACGATGPLASRHEPSGIPMRLWTDDDGADRSFADYAATASA
ncbi:MAG: hypothetical protein GX644_14275, partial [Limnobacter sp.]|nr:hypothetical protein [Limnobacter sp.]